MEEGTDGSKYHTEYSTIRKQSRKNKFLTFPSESWRSLGALQITNMHIFVQTPNLLLEAKKLKASCTYYSSLPQKNHFLKASTFYFWGNFSMEAHVSQPYLFYINVTMSLIWTYCPIGCIHINVEHYILSVFCDFLRLCHAHYSH